MTNQQPDAKARPQDGNGIEPVRRSSPRLLEATEAPTGGANDQKSATIPSSKDQRGDHVKTSSRDHRGSGQGSMDDLRSDITLPYAARPSIRISFCLTSLALSVIATVLMWIATRTPGETALSEQALAQALWRVDHVESSVSHLLFGVRQSALEHLAWYTQNHPSPINQFANAHSDILGRVAGLDAISSMSAIAGSNVVGYYVTQRQLRDRTSMAMYRVSNQQRNEWNIDGNGNPSSVIIGSQTYIMHHQPWWQSVLGQLAIRAAQSSAKVTWQSGFGAMTTTCAWMTMPITSTNDWLVLAAQTAIAPPDVPDATNVTVHVATDYSMLSLALSKGLGTLAADDTYGSLDYEAFLVDAGSMELIASSSSMTLRLSSLRAPLSQVATTAGVDPALKAFAVKAISAPDSVPLVHDASWTLTVSSDAYSASSTTSGLAYRYFVRNIVNPSPSSSATNSATFASPGSHGWPANWMLVVAVPASSTDDVVSSVRGSLFVLFSIIWAVISAVSLCVVMPVAKSLTQLARGSLLLATGTNPDVDTVLTNGDTSKRVPKEVMDLEGALALLVGQASFREFFFKWRKAKKKSVTNGGAVSGS